MAPKYFTELERLVGGGWPRQVMDGFSTNKEREEAKWKKKWEETERNKGLRNARERVRVWVGQSEKSKRD